MLRSRAYGGGSDFNRLHEDRHGIEAVHSKHPVSNLEPSSTFISIARIYR